MVNAKMRVHSSTQLQSYGEAHSHMPPTRTQGWVSPHAKTTTGGFGGGGS